MNPAVSVVVSGKQIINQPIPVLPSNSGAEDFRKDSAQPSPGSDGSTKMLDEFLGQLGSVGREDLKQNYGQLLAGWEKQSPGFTSLIEQNLRALKTSTQATSANYSSAGER
jgi:hypothetical protein